MPDVEQLAAETANWFLEGAAHVLGFPIADIPQESRDVGKEYVLAALQKAVEAERERLTTEVLNGMWRDAIRSMAANMHKQVQDESELSRPKREGVVH